MHCIFFSHSIIRRSQSAGSFTRPSHKPPTINGPTLRHDAESWRISPPRFSRTPCGIVFVLTLAVGLDFGSAFLSTELLTATFGQQHSGVSALLFNVQHLRCAPRTHRHYASLGPEHIRQQHSQSITMLHRAANWRNVSPSWQTPKMRRPLFEISI